MVGLAQAAALLLAIGLSWQAPITVPDALPALAEANVDVGEGQKVLIRSEGSKVDVVDLTALETAQSFPSIIPIVLGMYVAVDLTSPERSNGMDRWYLVHTEFESFSNSEIDLKRARWW